MYFQVNDHIKIYYELHGSDDAPIKVLLVMGWITTHKAWGKMVEHFTAFPQYQCCIFDNRGIGFSSVPSGLYSMMDMANDALALAEHIKWDKYHLVGASMGGMISLRMATTAPHKLLSLTLMATRYESGLKLPTWGAIGTIFRMKVTARSPEAQLHHMVSLFYPQKYLDQLRPSVNGIAPETNRQYLIKMLLARQQGVPLATSAGLIGQMGAIHSHGLTADEMAIIKNAGFKILLMTGDDDYMMPHVNTLKMKDVFGESAELMLLEGAGHGILEQCEHQINEKLHNLFMTNSHVNTTTATTEVSL